MLSAALLILSVRAKEILAKTVNTQEAGRRQNPKEGVGNFPLSTFSLLLAPPNGRAEGGGKVERQLVCRLSQSITE